VLCFVLSKIIQKSLQWKRLEIYNWIS
jgi:hypothetical protein